MKKSNIMRILSAALVFVMVFGLFTFFAPEGIVLTASALSYNDEGYTDFYEGDQIRIINKSREGKSKSDTSYQLGASGWAPATSDYVVWDGTGENTFYGVYPAADHAKYDSFTIPTDQSSDALLAYADWMTATYTGTRTDSVDLKFSHLLTMVTVKINAWNSEFEGSEKVIKNPSIYTKGTELTISYGTGTDGANVYTPQGNDADITPLRGGGYEYPTYTAIVAPVAYDANDEFMTFTVDGQELTVFAKNDQLTGGLQPGNHYTFHLTIGKDAVTLTSVNVTDWTEMEIDGGVATEVCQHVNIENGICTNCGTKFFDYDESTNTAQVSTAEGLLAWNKEACADLAINLTLAADITLAGENNWTPVGYFDATEGKSYPYMGTIDGGGHTISGLHINSTACTQAFVGSLSEGGSIKNLTFANAQVIGANWSGVVTGTNGGTIENCFVTSGSLTSTGGSSGVFAGYNTGKVIGCTNTATVALAIGSQKSYMGGIVGINISSGTIIGCINTGAVSGYSSIGGVAGYNDRGIVVACGNTGSVTYTYGHAGGIVGFTGGYSGANARIIGCWTCDTNEHNGTNEVTEDKNGIGNESEYLTISMCFSGEVATINGKVSDMNSTIDNTYGYIWQTGTDGYPTLVATE